MFWHQVSANRFERACDANEVFLKTIADATAHSKREHWTVNTIARLKVDIPDVEKALSRAWIHTRNRAPFVACLVTDLHLFYEVPDQAALSRWLAESFFVEEQTVERFLLNVQPRAYSSLHYFPASCHIVMRLHHWLADGVGSLSILDILLSFLAEDKTAPCFGNEWQNLPPSHHQASGFPEEPSQAGKEHAQKMFTELVGNLPSIGLPVDIPTKGVKLGGPKKFSKRFDPSMSASIISACKKKGFSVSSAFHAAVVVATQENASPATQGLNYTSIAAFNYRPYLPVPYNDSKAWPTGAYIIGPPITLPMADFTAQAHRLHEFYHQPLRKGEAMLFEAYETYIRKLLAAFSTPSPPGVPAATTPEISNLGVLDKYVQAEYAGRYRVELEDVEVAVDQIASNVIFYSWSFKGRLGLSVVFNEAFYKDLWVQGFFEHVQDSLIQGLALRRQ